MKKLMIAVCGIAIAVVSQGATVKWSASGVYERGSTTAKAGSPYIAYFISSADYSFSDAQAALGKGDLSFVKSYGQAEAVFANDSSTGAGKGSANNVVTTTAGNEEPWTGYLVILDNSVTSVQYAYLADEMSKTTGKTGGVANFSWTSTMMTGTQTASNWYAVPEPTSGLLLLLGVAGLALKRRRA